MRILNFLWLKSTENITIFNYIPNTAPQFLQIKNYFHPKLEHISKTYIRCPRYSDRHCIVCHPDDENDFVIVQGKLGTE